MSQRLPHQHLYNYISIFVRHLSKGLDFLKQQNILDVTPDSCHSVFYLWSIEINQMLMISYLLQLVVGRDKLKVECARSFELTDRI